MDPMDHQMSPRVLSTIFFRGARERVRVIVLSLSCPVVSFYIPMEECLSTAPVDIENIPFA